MNEVIFEFDQRCFGDVVRVIEPFSCNSVKKSAHGKSLAIPSESLGCPA